MFAFGSLKVMVLEDLEPAPSAPVGEMMTALHRLLVQDRTTCSAIVFHCDKDRHEWEASMLRNMPLELVRKVEPRSWMELLPPTPPIYVLPGAVPADTVLLVKGQKMLRELLDKQADHDKKAEAVSVVDTTSLPTDTGNPQKE